jgi:hypothetical protein
VTAASLVSHSSKLTVAEPIVTSSAVAPETVLMAFCTALTQPLQVMPEMAVVNVFILNLSTVPSVEKSPTQGRASSGQPG